MGDPRSLLALAATAFGPDDTSAGFEGGYREPEGVQVLNRLELITFKRAIDSPSENVEPGTGNGIDEAVTVGS